MDDRNVVVWFVLRALKFLFASARWSPPCVLYIKHRGLFYGPHLKHISFKVCIILFNDAVGNITYYLMGMVEELMNMEQWWNDTDRGKLNYWEKNIIQRGW